MAMAGSRDLSWPMSYTDTVCVRGEPVCAWVRERARERGLLRGWACLGWGLRGEGGAWTWDPGSRRIFLFSMGIVIWGRRAGRDVV